MTDASSPEKSFGAALKALLKQRGLTQYKFGQKAGLKKDHVSRLVNGKTKQPHDPTVEKIAKGLDLSVEAFWKAIGAQQSAGMEAVEVSGQATSQTEPEALPSENKRPIAFIGAEQIREIPVWVGREVLLESLTFELVDVQRKVILLLGQGGIGKTSLAVKLLEQAEIDTEEGVLRPGCLFEQVVYLRVGKGAGFDAVLQQLAQGIELKLTEKMKPEQKVDALVQRLKQRRYLVVLDNFEDVLEGGRCQSEELGQLLWAMTARPHLSQLILTSREMVQDLVDPREPGGLPNPMQVKVERLPGIGTGASVALLKNYGLEDDEADLIWVARRVGGHVLLLTLLAKLAIGKKGYLRKNPQLVSRKAGPILEEQLGRQSEAAVELLKRMCVPRGAIGAEGLTFLRLYEDGQEVVLAQEEVERTELLLKQLSDASLVQWRFDEERCEDLYDLHQVIVDFLQSKYAADFPELMKRVYEFYRAGSYISNPKLLEDLEPVLETYYFTLQLRDYDEAWRLLSRNLTTYLKRWGHWNQLKELLMQIAVHLEGSAKAGCWGWLSTLYRDTGDWNKAEGFIRKALEMTEELGDRLSIANLWKQLGFIESKWGKWDEAERLYRKCLEVEEELGDHSGMANSWGLLGDIKRNRGNWDEAKRLYRKCLEVEEELGDRSGMASSWGVLGDIERDRGNWDEAEQLYQQSIRLRQELGERAGVVWVTSDRGANELGRGNLELAESFLAEALEQLEQLGIRDALAENHEHFAKLYRAKGNPDLAQTHYATAHRLFTQLGAVKDLERIEKEWAES